MCRRDVNPCFALQVNEQQVKGGCNDKSKRVIQRQMPQGSNTLTTVPKFHDKRHTTYIRYFHFFSWSQGKNITKPFLIEGKINAQTSWRECGKGTLDLENGCGDEKKVIEMAFLESGQLWVFFVPGVRKRDFTIQ